MSTTEDAEDEFCEFCSSCGRPIDGDPELIEMQCTKIREHRCNTQTYAGPCVRPWGHSRYADRCRPQSWFDRGAT